MSGGAAGGKRKLENGDEYNLLKNLKAFNELQEYIQENVLACKTLQTLCDAHNVDVNEKKHLLSKLTEINKCLIVETTEYHKRELAHFCSWSPVPVAAESMPVAVEPMFLPLCLKDIQHTRPPVYPEGSKVSRNDTQFTMQCKITHGTLELMASVSVTPYESDVGSVISDRQSENSDSISTIVFQVADSGIDHLNIWVRKECNEMNIRVSEQIVDVSEDQDFYV